MDAPSEFPDGSGWGSVDRGRGTAMMKEIIEIGRYAAAAGGRSVIDPRHAF
jgi:hypothetical protein